jgi:hypothetical protein
MRIVQWRDPAYSRLTRTIRMGDELLTRLSRSRRTDLSAGLILAIEDWHELTAFFVNFVMDGDAAPQLETLGYDPRREESTERIGEFSRSLIRRRLLMRITMLKKWFDEIMDKISAMEALHWQILNALYQRQNHQVDRFHLQMRLKVENPLLLDALQYLQHQGLLVYTEHDELIALTKDGSSRAVSFAKSDPMTKQHRLPNDLIFFSYASEDRARVAGIHAQIDELGFNTWIDTINLVAGQDWDYEITTAIEQAAIGLVFLSNRSVEKTGYVNKEIKRILDKMDLMPEGKVFIIPIRLDDCAILRRLSKWQVLSATDVDFEKRLISALRHSL